MMRLSRGGCTQPRNFQRALHQSREAGALKLVDAVDVEGNVQGSGSLPEIINKFFSFLLELLSKECREAIKGAAASRAAAAALASAADAAETAAGGAAAAVAAAVAAAAEEPKPKGAPTIDEMVARQYEEKLKASNAAAAPTAAAAAHIMQVQAAAAAAAAAAPAAPAAAADAAPADEAGAVNVVERLFGASWSETTNFPGARGEQVQPQAQVRRLTSMTLTLKNRAEAKDFPALLEACLSDETRPRAWCAELSRYMAAQQVRRIVDAPNVWAMLCPSDLPATYFEEWSGDKPWLPPKFHLDLGTVPDADGGGGGGGGEAPAEAPAADAAADAAAAPAAAEGAPVRVLTEMPAEGGEGLIGYELRGMISFTQSTLAHAAAGSGHLVLAFKVPPPPPKKKKKAAAAAAAPAVAPAAAAPAAAAPAAAESVEGAVEAMVAAVVAGAGDGDGAAAEAPPAEAEAARRAAEAAEAAEAEAALAAEVAAEVDDWGRDGGDGGWLVWNDFALARATESEVLSLHSKWRRPCVLLYARVDLPARAASLPLKPANPVASAASLAPEFSLREPPMHAAAASFTPLGTHELPPPRGMLVAIDAEFVAVSRELTRLDHRGKAVVLKPARLALARVSCVRGAGPMAGVPFIDSYIRQAEPVVDYLTRFSGLHPGDLDPSVSAHHITTMKATYIKLRQLADAGCRFVGHGLSKDFEIINLALPPEQVPPPQRPSRRRAHRPPNPNLNPNPRANRSSTRSSCFTSPARGGSRCASSRGTSSASRCRTGCRTSTTRSRTRAPRWRSTTSTSSSRRRAPSTTRCSSSTRSAATRTGRCTTSRSRRPSSMAPRRHAKSKKG